MAVLVKLAEERLLLSESGECFLNTFSYNSERVWIGWVGGGGVGGSSVGVVCL